jgi:hypothetical protein
LALVVRQVLEPLSVAVEVVTGSSDHHGAADCKDLIGADEPKLTSHVHPAAVAARDRGRPDERPLDRHRAHVFDGEFSGDGEFVAQQQCVARHLVEHARRPAAVCHFGSAFVVGGAGDLAADRPVLDQGFAVQPESASARCVTRPTQQHAGW